MGRPRRDLRNDSKTLCLFCNRIGLSSSRVGCGLGTEVKEDESSVFNTVLRNDTTISLSNEGRNSLQSQVRAVFIARKLLDVPVEKCAEYLMNNDGAQDDPGLWFSVCTGCTATVEEAYKIYCEIVQLNIKLEEVKRKLKSSIVAGGTTLGEFQKLIGNRNRRKSRGQKDHFIHLDIRNYVLAEYGSCKAQSKQTEIVRRSPRKRKIIEANIESDDHITLLKDNPGIDSYPVSPNQYRDNVDDFDYQPVFHDENVSNEEDDEPEENGIKRFQIRKQTDTSVIAGSEQTSKRNEYNRMLLRVDTPYYCDNCHMIFTSLPQLYHHVQLYHIDVPKRLCTICDMEFETKQLLEMHCKDDHPTMETENSRELDTRDEKPQICPHCSDSFPSILKRDFHIAKFHKDKLLTCKICGHKFKKYCYLLKHDRKMHKKIGLMCDKCPKAFDTPCSLRNHMSLVHRMEPSKEAMVWKKCTVPIYGRPFKTPMPKRKFAKRPIPKLKVKVVVKKSDASSAEHKNTYEYSNYNAISEEYCENNDEDGQFYSNEEADIGDEDGSSAIEGSEKPQVHVKMRPSKKYRYKCRLCCAHFGYDKLQPIRQHQKLHDENIGIPCPECGWLCEEGKLLFHTSRRHPGRSREGREKIIREHGGIPYYCDNCHMIFPSILLMRKHLKLHHPKVPKLVCEFCDHESETKQLLELHCAEEHTTGPTMEMEESLVQVQEPKDEKSHNCLFCSVEFPSIVKRDYHIADRHKDKILNCTLCGHKFKTWFNLAKHDRQRHQQMSFDCKICPKKYDAPKALRRHMSKGHCRKTGTKVSSIKRKRGVSGLRPSSSPVPKRQVGKRSTEDNKKKRVTDEKQEGPDVMAETENINTSSFPAAPYKRYSEDDCNIADSVVSDEELSNEIGSPQEVKIESRRMRTCRIRQGAKSEVLDTGINTTELSDDDNFSSHPDDDNGSDWEPIANEKVIIDEQDEDDESAINEEKGTCQRKGGEWNAEQESIMPATDDNQETTREFCEPREIIRPKLMFHCDLCVAFYRTTQKVSIEKHLRLHEESTGKPCTYCGWLCEEKKLQSHINYRHPGKRGDEKPLSRRAPKLKVGKRRQVNNSYEYKIFRGKIPYYCDNCHMIYPTEQRLINHCIVYHPQASSQLCSICDSPFETKQLLDLHTKEVHSNEKSSLVQEEPHEPQVCLYCQETFPSKLKRDYHIATRHLDKLHTCTLCNQKFSKYQSLYYHNKQQHENEKIMCEKCPKSFSGAYYLKFHMASVHHEDLGVEPLICKECNVTFAGINGMQMHMEAVHQKVKRHCCEYCGKAFSRTGDLGKHVLLHTAPPEKRYKQGPFFCQFCQAKFNVRQALYYHLKRLHSNKYEFKCDNCGTGYVTKNTLLQHLRKCKAKVASTSLSSSAEMESTTELLSLSSSA